MDHDSSEWKRLSNAARYLVAADEDLLVVERLREHGVPAPHDICMLSARASEKYIKSKSLLLGREPRKSHDQSRLLDTLGDFKGVRRAKDLAAVLSPYSTEANYPSDTMDAIDRDAADAAHSMLMEMMSMIQPHSWAIPGESVLDPPMSRTPADDPVYGRTGGR
ncbi:MAG: HEPN domain-containing protein [Candidatus Methanomethylophilaceae archaeon]|nr:HEPN domain-containing protein [Candidatus Methanomethylophilaceae archaeon]